MAYNNSSNINVTGIVKADGSGDFTGLTTTQYNVQVGAATNGLTSIAPSATSGIALISQGAGANPTFGTVVPAGGGTGTSTVFTQGSVVFADGSGIYAQDNANFFWDDTNNRLAVGTNTPVSNLDVNGNISVGTYAGTNAGPTNGMIISGQVGIGTSTVGANNMLQINPNVGHGVSVQGTMTAVDAGNNQHSFNSAPTFAPTNGSTISSGFEATATFAAPAGKTISRAASFRSSPSFTGNAGTIDYAHGIYYDGGGATAGTINNAYGGWFDLPLVGTTKCALYAKNMIVGAPSYAPASGLAVMGQTSLGTNSPIPNVQLYVYQNGNNFASIFTENVLTGVDGGPNQFGIISHVEFVPPTGGNGCYNFYGTPMWSIPTAQTVTEVANFYSMPDFTLLQGNITTAYGIYCNSGTNLFSGGTINYNYGGYFKTPAAGTTKIPLYADSATFGITSTAAPTNGLLVNGAIRNYNLTAKAVVYADANKDLTSVALTNGQLLIGSTGANPVAATLSAGTNISITNAAGAITINSTASGGTSWKSISANQTLVVGEGYFCASPGGALSLALPAVSAVGATIEVVLAGATSWTVTQGAGQQVVNGNISSTLGATGTTGSTAQGDSVRLVCAVANTIWYIVNSIGNINSV